jgi:hypothetical protein
MEKERKPLRHFGLQLTEEDIRRAMANTRSNAEAARFMKLDIRTYKKYAKMYQDQLTGQTLWKLHMNTSSKGIPKKWITNPSKENLEGILTKNQINNPKRLAKLKDLLMKDGRLGYCCSACDYSEKRLTDMKTPLMINFKNGERTDWTIDNLQWLCYNCSFILGLDYFSNRLIRDVESASKVNVETQEDIKKFYEIDDFYLDHLAKLGLDDRGDIIKIVDDNIIDNKIIDDGNEFIDFQ